MIVYGCTASNCRQQRVLCLSNTHLYQLYVMMMEGESSFLGIPALCLLDPLMGGGYWGYLGMYMNTYPGLQGGQDIRTVDGST